MKKTEIIKATMGLGLLTEKNVSAVYKKEFLKWSLLNSDKVTSNGEDVSKLEIAFKFLSTENRWETAKGTFNYCNTQNGFTLTKEMFHQEQVSRYEPINFFTQGKPQYRTINARINLYLDYSQSEVKKPKFEFTNIFDEVPEDKVYKYFYQNLVETNMLTEDEFHQYLKVAFEEQAKPKKKFVLKNSRGKGRTTKIFSLYRKDVAGTSNGNLQNYVGLLGDYFEGYKNNQSLYSNFNK